MKFNPAVFHALVQLTCKSYWGKKKVSRTSLIDTLRRYWNQNEIPKSKKRNRTWFMMDHKPTYRETIPGETLELLGDLCVRILTREPLKGQEKQIDSLRSSANQLIKNQVLNEDQIAVLLKNLNRCPQALNRVLRHPGPSALISAWARANFNNNSYRRRRAELLAWLLSEDSDYTIPLDVLIADFEHANEEDRLEEERATGQYPEVSTLDETFPGMFSPKKEPIKSEYSEPFDGDNWIQGANFKPRFFDRKYQNTSLHHNAEKYDSATLIPFFYSNLETTQKVTMLWGYYYSHLPLPQKRKLLKKWYHPSIHKSFSRICVKMKDVKLLEWLLKKES
jgi:hypothetical protein